MSLLFRHMQPGKGKALVRRTSPSKFISVLKRKQQQFDGTQQQDAHELFSALLNACDEEARALFRLPPIQPTFILDVFQGELSSEIRCLACERVSYRKETFMDLSLDVEHCCSVAHCLQSFTAVETMSGSNKFMCEACNGLQEAHRRCRVRRWPRCLLLQLKRFKVIESGGAYYNKKLNARVEFAREMRLSGSAAAEDESDAGSSKASAAACSDTMCVLLCSALLCPPFPSVFAPQLIHSRRRQVLPHRSGGAQRQRR
jgi:ubiquitin C-terminal hydrolase